MYNLGFAMGVLAIIGALLIYKYRAPIGAAIKKAAAWLWAKIKKTDEAGK